MNTIACELERESRVYAIISDQGIPLPAVLDRHEIRRRYVVPAMKIIEDEHGSPESLVFYDGSIAERDEVDARIWREKRDA